MTKIEERFGQYREHVENFFADWYGRFADEPQNKLFEAMRYSLLAGGKRLRPIFAYEFCRMCGAPWQKAAPFAAAVEMIHTYSLIHDDLPCMDNDDLRRGKPTNHKVYGEALAVLAGDALLTDAFSVAATAQISGSAMADAIGVLSECAGSLGMVGGQVLDIMSEERILSEQEVLDIQSRKTGALIRAACAMGVLAGGGSDAQFDAACQFAAGLGLAFQIRDDMLDVIGNASEMGKAVGVDTNKNTFVSLYGLEICNQMVIDHTQKAVQSLGVFDEYSFMQELSERLTGRTA